GLAAHARQPASKPAVMVPILVIELDESNAALREPPREDAVRRERAGLARVGAVLLEHMIRLAREIGGLGDRRLHSERELVLSDPRLDRRIRRSLELELMKLAQAIDHPTSG